MTAPWWRETVVYQIYPRSYVDSDGDGIGDLAGIRSRLDHLEDLGVETLWLSPFFESPQRDFGYDIRGYRGVAPEYGDLDQVDGLIEDLHRRGMKLVLDMVLNHTSDEHPWFLESRASRANPKRDWYIWRDGRKPDGKAPPNNWRSMLGGRGWHYDPTTGQWYWAQFLPFQPDLNFRNPEVRAAMLGHMRFWLDRGVDGFRLDLVNAIFEDEHFRDNPPSRHLFPSEGHPTMLFRGTKHTLDHPDTVAFMKELRRTVDAYSDPPRFLVGEVNAPMPSVRAHCGEQGDGLNLAFLFDSLGVPLRAGPLRKLIGSYEEHFAEPLLPTWVFANHDRVRRISRLGDDLTRAKLNAMLQLTARGVPFLYYGEEIGMVQQHMPIRDSLDPVTDPWRWIPQPVVEAARRLIHESLNRDECRTPMQWTDAEGAGFCSPGVEPWLPIGARHRERTVSAQGDDPTSLMACYRRLLHLRRKRPALHRGDLELLPERGRGDPVLGYHRSAATERGVDHAWVVLNTAGRSVRIAHPAPRARLGASTRHDRGEPGGTEIELAPLEGLVLIDTEP